MEPWRGRALCASTLHSTPYLEFIVTQEEVYYVDHGSICKRGILGQRQMSRTLLPRQTMQIRFCFYQS